jgi:hypothetical protein
MEIVHMVDSSGLMRRPAAQRVSGIELQTNNHLLHI